MRGNREIASYRNDRDRLRGWHRGGRSFRVEREETGQAPNDQPNGKGKEAAMEGLHAAGRGGESALFQGATRPRRHDLYKI